jgi:hypothetical protein
LALKKHALEAGRLACDAQNLGHDRAYVVGFPIRYLHGSANVGGAGASILTAMMNFSCR